ncbi:MAG TPA: SseB family protein [Phycisphaerae bacterium]|nr:SseB family protein [Phycisphaerae bacterium]
MGLFTQFFGHKKVVIENGPLITAMQRAEANPMPQSVRAVHQALLESKLLIPTTRAVGEASGWLGHRSEKELTVPMVSSRKDDGQVDMIVFTDEQSLKAWAAKDCGWVAMRGPDVFAVALETRVDHIVINPNGPTGRTLDRPQIASLAEGLAAANWIAPEGGNSESMQAEESAVPEPRKAPTVTLSVTVRPLLGPVEPSLQDRFHKALAERPEVSAGYLFNVTVGGAAPQLGVGVEFAGPMSPEAVNETLGRLRAQTREAVTGGVEFEFLPLTREDLRGSAREHGLRFYYAPLTACDHSGAHSDEW